jgi:hypothetical protein
MSQPLFSGVSMSSIGLVQSSLTGNARIAGFVIDSRWRNQTTTQGS